MQPGNVYNQRGKIKGLSSASRKRLLDLLASLEFGSVFSVHIVLTYPDKYPTTIRAKQNKRSMLERIRRRFPETSGIWRIEYQKRGAPHFHLLLFDLPFVPKEDVQLWWSDIIGYPRAFTSIDAVDAKAAGRYVAKYIAKKDGVEPERVQICDTDKPTKSETENDSPGRSWGVFNRKKLPFADTYSLTAPVGRWYHDLLELSRLHWDGLDPDVTKGFTLYLDDAITFLQEFVDKSGALSDLYKP